MNKAIVPLLIMSSFAVFAFVVVRAKSQPEPTLIYDDQSSLAAAKKKAGAASGPVLYYGASCPHCIALESYIAQNVVESRIVFARKEVYKDADNAQEMSERAEACGLRPTSVGVPFFWDGYRCYVGDQDIIKFFEAKIK
jgi:glutaredoxin